MNMQLSAKLRILFQPRAIPCWLLAWIAAVVAWKMACCPDCYPDDLTHLYTLHRYINGGHPLHSPGGDAFSACVAIWGIRALYVPVLIAAHAMGATFPFIVASRFWALVLIPMTYWIWTLFLEKRLETSTARWASVAVVGFNTANYIITDGLARSFNLALLGLWAMAMRRRSTGGLLAVFALSSILYPIWLPVMGLALFFACAFTWRNSLSWRRRAGMLAAGFAGAVSYQIARYFLYPQLAQHHFMGYAQMMAFTGNGVIRGHLLLPWIAGRMPGMDLERWIELNLFYKMVPPRASVTRLIIAAAACMPVLALLFRRARSSGLQNGLYAAALWIQTLALILVWMRAGDMHLALCWFLVLAMEAFFLFHGKQAWRALPWPLDLAALAAPLAFGLVCLAFIFVGFFFDEPGRQLQKPFAAIAPVIAVLWLSRVWKTAPKVLAVFPIAALICVLAVSPQISGHRYDSPRVMEALQALPPDALILAHPKTCDAILALAGKSTTSAEEMVRVAAMPYTQNIMRAKQQDLSILYSTHPEPVMRWCAADPGRRFILVEKKRMNPKNADAVRVLGKSGSRSFFLENPPCGPGVELDKGVNLFSCDRLLGARQ